MKKYSAKHSIYFASIALLFSAFVNATPQHSLGVQVTATEFQENNFFGPSSKQFTDDSDTGYGVYYNVSWSSLKSFRVGYLDHGEFTYLQSSTEYSGSSDTFYIAWAPYYKINDKFDIGLALGIGENTLDTQGRTDEDTAMLISAELNYKIHQSVNLGAEIGTVGKVVGDIDPRWVGIKLSYVW